MTVVPGTRRALFPRGRRSRAGGGLSPTEAMLLVIPALLPVVILSVLPLGRGIYLAFTDAQAGFEVQTSWIGLDNFRELLAPDPALRKKIWTVLGGPGMVLVDGELAGLWRPAKKGRKLVVTVEPLGELSNATKDALAAEAARLAPYRGVVTGELAWA